MNAKKFKRHNWTHAMRISIIFVFILSISISIWLPIFFVNMFLNGG